MEAIIFDLFETLVSHRDPDFVPPERTIAERLNVDDSSYEVLWPVLEDEWERGRVASHEDALYQLCNKAGVKPNKPEIEKLAFEFWERLLNIFRRIEPEIVDMLESLQRLGLRLGVVTNAHNADTEPWNECSLSRYFDVFIASHEVGFKKPEIEIYLLACNQLGVNPSDAYFVGDGGSDELKGAAQAGMGTYWWTWFLDKWPAGITPHTFVGGEWRERPRDRGAPYTMIRSPETLISEITRAGLRPK